MATIHLIIQGKVQGVFFRVSARKTAIVLGITGWVKNTPEKHVEIMASGTTDQLEKFVEWCEKGPSEASVERVVIEEAGEQQFEAFTILH